MASYKYLTNCVWEQLNNLFYFAAHQKFCCFPPLVVFITPFFDEALLIKRLRLKNRGLILSVRLCGLIRAIVAGLFAMWE